MSKSGDKHCLTVPPSPLVVGSEIQVCYEATPGQTVTIEIDNGRNPPTVEHLEVTAGDDGVGCAEWTVPEWRIAVFRCGDCAAVTRTIVEGDPTQSKPIA